MLIRTEGPVNAELSQQAVWSRARIAASVREMFVDRGVLHNIGRRHRHPRWRAMRPIYNTVGFKAAVLNLVLGKPRDLIGLADPTKRIHQQALRKWRRPSTFLFNDSPATTRWWGRGRRLSRSATACQATASWGFRAGDLDLWRQHMHAPASGRVAAPLGCVRTSASSTSTW